MDNPISNFKNTNLDILQTLNPEIHKQIDLSKAQILKFTQIYIVEVLTEVCHADNVTCYVCVLHPKCFASMHGAQFTATNP